MSICQVEKQVTETLTQLSANEGSAVQKYDNLYQVSRRFMKNCVTKSIDNVDFEMEACNCKVLGC